MDFSSLLLPPAADLYPHAFTRYRRSETRSAAGKHTGFTLASTLTGQVGLFEVGQSAKGVQGGLLAEGDNLFTLDQIHTPASQEELQVEDVLLQTTGPDAGAYWTVRGDSQNYTQIAQKRIVRAARTPKKPNWVP